MNLHSWQKLLVQEKSLLIAWQFTTSCSDSYTRIPFFFKGSGQFKFASVRGLSQRKV